MKSKKEKWQKKFIKDVFDRSIDKKKSFSKMILKNPNLVNEKNEFLPNSLFKYYAPTSDNILDIKNQRLWLAHPQSFNDPFDCNIGYDIKKYEKNCLLKFINENGCVDESNKEHGFTVSDKNRIIRSRLENCSYEHEYMTVLWKILETKADDFQQKILMPFSLGKAQEISDKIAILRNENIRVACFSNFEKYAEFPNQIVMWSHYADNHKGFCIEYNLESLKKNTSFSLSDAEFYKEKKNEYLTERNNAIIKAGLFPVEYTANRVNIPVSKLHKINIDASGNLTYNSNIDELFYKALLVKSANWSFEKEWRIIIDGQVSEYFGNKIPFPYIKTIYVGCKASIELIKTMTSIGTEIGAEVVFLYMNETKFHLESSALNVSYEREKHIKKFKNPYA